MTVAYKFRAKKNQEKARETEKKHDSHSAPKPLIIMSLQVQIATQAMTILVFFLHNPETRVQLRDDGRHVGLTAMCRCVVQANATRMYSLRASKYCISTVNWSLTEFNWSTFERFTIQYISPSRKTPSCLLIKHSKHKMSSGNPNVRRAGERLEKRLHFAGDELSSFNNFVI